MALYDNKLWLLSHIRNSFISTDDTGMSELVMVEENVPKHVAEKLDYYHDSEDNEEDDDDILYRGSFDLHFDMDFGANRYRSNTDVILERLEQVKKKAAKVRHVKWELSTLPPLAEELDQLFIRKDLHKNEKKCRKKSLLSQSLEISYNLPQNPFIEYAKFDGNAQISIMTKKYKIFLTMLPEELRNYPITISCIASATVQQLVGLILLNCSLDHGEVILKSVSHYGLYITEEDGEVDQDLPNLNPGECIAKFSFPCLGLVEHTTHDSTKNITFETTKVIHNELVDVKQLPDISKAAEQLKETMEQIKVHKAAMEAPLYQSYTVYIVNKVRVKAEIHLGISGDKIEIDSMQQKNSKFALVRQKPISHHIDSIAWCEITDTKSNGTSFKVVYSLPFGHGQSSSLQTSTSFKHYDFEADNNTAEEIVNKINLILDLRTNCIRKEYIRKRETKQPKRKFFA